MSKLDEDPQNLRNFQAFVEIVAALRGPEGCPWDKKQTHKSLTRYAIEEVYEMVETIEENNMEHLKEELGDMLLQVVLHAQIGKDEGNFDIHDVIESIAEKMIRRHPHVFSNEIFEDDEELKQNWESIKKAEKAKKGQNSKNVFDLPGAMPALLRSQKIGEKTKKVGFDWDSPFDVIAKVEEELAELKESLKTSDTRHQQEELGDVLFSLAQVCRHLGFEAEQTLRLSNQKFETRYQGMLDLCEERKLDFPGLSADKKEDLWREVKKRGTP